MIETQSTTRQIGIRQRSLRRHCRLGRATELVFVLATGVTLTMSGAATAQTWDGGADPDNSFIEGTNWDGDVAPAPVGAAVIDGAGGANQPTVNVGDAPTVATAAISGGTLTIIGTLTATTGVTISDTGTVLVSAGTGALIADTEITEGGLLSVGGVVTGNIDNGGITPGGLDITSTGLVTGNVTSSGNGSNAGVTAVTTGIDGDLEVTDGTFDNAGIVTGNTSVTGGALNLDAGTDLDDAGSVTVSGTGTLTVNAADTVGSVNLDGGTIDGAETLTTTTFDQTGGDLAGTISASGDKTLEGGTLSGTLEGAGATTVQTGTTTVTGTIDGDVTVATDGVLRIESATAVSGSITTTGSTVSYGDGQDEGSALIISSATTDLEVLAGEAATQSGVISSTGAFGFEKVGDGNLTVLGTNTYTGVTDVSAGTLTVANPAGLGATGAGNETTVDAGATLAVTGGIATAEAITLNGTGVADGGALRGVSGNNGVSGAITLGSATRINTDSGQLDITGGITGAFDLTVGGAGTTFIASDVATGAGTLTKDGDGILTLGAANDFTGATTVTGGSLRVTATGALSDTGLLTVTAPGFVQLFADETVGNISGDGGIFLESAGLTLTAGDATNQVFSGEIGQDGANAANFTKEGSGTLTLSGTSTYTGTTTVDGGVLDVTGSVATLSNVVNATGTLRVDGASLDNSATVTLNGNGILDVAGDLEQIAGLISASATSSVTLGSNTLVLNGDGDASVLETTTFAGGISGTGGLIKTGTDIQVLSGTNTHSGTTTVAGGELHLNGGAALLDTGAVAVNGGRLVLNTSETIGSLASTGSGGEVELNANTLTIGGDGDVTPNENTIFAGAINGTGNLIKTGDDTQTFTGNNTYGGTTTISEGTLRAGNGGTTGNFGAGNVAVAAGATAELNRSDNITIANLFTGAGTLTQSGTGTTTLTGVNGGANQFTGTGNINAGAVLVNGTFGDTVGNTAVINVNTGGTLQGTGTIAGNVNVNTGGTLAAGASPGVLTVAGDLDLDGASVSAFELGAPNNPTSALNDRVDVGGVLTLDGTLNVTSATLADGYYRLFTHGSLVNSGLTVGTLPLGASAATVLTNVGGEVNLRVGNTPGTQFWDGSVTNASNGSADGGNGTWSASEANWTISNGTFNDAWGSNDAEFGGAAGTVTVSGTQLVNDIDFVTSGYVLNGGTLSLTGGPSEISVVAAGTATINSVLSGTGGLDKTGDGTLVLGGNNLFSGTTAVLAGELAVTGSGALASTVVNVSGTGTLTTDADALAAGATVTVSGTGTFTGNGADSYTAISQSGGTINGAGLQTLSGTFSQTGGDMGGVVSATGGSALNGGTISGSLSGGLATAASGTTNVTGSITSSGLTVSGGTVNLNGTGNVDTSSNIIGISAGALTNDGNGIADNEAVTVSGSGTLTTNGTDTIASLTQSGGTVNGSALLTAGTYGQTGGDMAGLLAATTSAALNGGTISGTLSGGLATAASGTTNVTGSITSSGLTVSGGTVNLNGAGNVNTTGNAITVSAGALVNDGNGIADNEAVTVSGTGTLTTNGTDTIASLDQQGGTVDGTALLTAGTYTQSGGDMAGLVATTTSATLNGGTISGTLSGAAATVQTGTTTLTGTISADTTITSTLEVDGGDLTGSNTLNGGTLAGLSDSTITGSVATSAAGGTITAAAGTTLTLDTLDPLNGAALAIGSSGQTGTVVVNGTSGQTNTNTVAINAGTLQIGGAGVGNSLLDFIAGTSVASGATLDIGGFATEVNVLSGSGIVTNSGAAAGLTLTGTSSFGGVIQNGAGTTALTIEGGTARGENTDVTLTGNNTFSGGTTVTGASGLTASLTLSGAGSNLSSTGLVTVNTDGTLVIDGDETIGALAGTGTGAVDISSGTLTTGDATNTSYAGTISGAGDLVKNGTGTFTATGDISNNTVTVNVGTLVLSGTNTMGQITVAGATPGAATLRLESDDAAGGTGGLIRTTGSIIDYADTVNNVTDIEIASNTTQVNVDVGAAEQSGDIGEDVAPRPLEKTGAGTLTLSGMNSYTGTTTISEGTLIASGGSAIADIGLVTVVSGANFELATSETVGNLSGAGDVELNANTLTTGGANTNSEFSGVISGTGGLVKTGTGIMNLQGVSTYTGPTDVTGGNLRVVGTGALASTDLETTAGGILSSDGGALALAAVVTNAGGFNLIGGGDESIAAVNGAGTVFLSGGSVLTLNTGASAISGIISGSGGLTVAGTSATTLSAVNTYSGATNVNANGTLTIANGGSIVSTSTVAAGGTMNVNVGGTAAGIGNAGTLMVAGSAGAVSNSGNGSNSGSIASLSNTGGTFTNTGIVSGTTTVSGGTVNLNAGSNLSNSAALTVSGGIVNVNTAETVGSLVANGGTTNVNATLTALALSGTAGSIVTTTPAGVIAGGSNTSTSFGGVISGDGFLQKAGSGTLTLTNANTFTGGTTVSGGTLALTGAGALSGPSITIDPLATLSTDGGALTILTTIRNDGTFALTAGGDESIANIFNTGSSNPGAITLSSGSLLTLNTGASTISGVISGAGALTVAGTSVTTLSGANTYTGDTTVSGGTLTLLGGAALDNNNRVIVSGGALNVNAAETIGSLEGTGGPVTLNTRLTTGDNDATTTYSGVITGLSGLTKIGTGTFTLSGANTYVDTTIVNEGSLVLTGGLALANSNAVELNGTANLTVATAETIGSLAGTADTTATLTATLTTGGNNTGTTMAGDMSGAGGLTKEGTGDMVLSGTNSYAGTTTINAGELTLQGGTAIVDTGTVVINGGTLDVDTAETIGSLAGVAGTFTNLDATLTTGFNNATTTYAGVVQGTGGLTKVGTGTFTLSGVNTYSGLTTVNAGTLRITSTGQLTASNALVASGATLDNFGTIQNVTNNGTFTNQAGAFGGALTNGATGSATNAGTLASVVNTGSFTSNSGVVSGLTTNNGGLVTINSGTFTGGLNNTSGTVSAQGTMSGDVTNAGTFSTTGALTGGGSSFTNTNDLTVETGSYTGLGAVSNSGTVTITGQTLEGTSISNSNSTLLTDGILSSAVTNGGVIGVAGNSTINGTLGAGMSVGTVDLSFGSGVDSLTLSGGGIISNQNLVLSVFDDGVNDTVVSTGGAGIAATGNVAFNFLIDETVFLLGEEAVIVQGQTGFNQSFLINGGLVTGSTVFSLLDRGGDTVLVRESNPGIGGIASGVSLTQALIGNVVNRPSSPFASGLAAEEGCSQGGYARVVVGRSKAEGTSDNGESVTTNEVSANYRGIQGSYDFGCNDGRFFDGWDASFGVLAGVNSGDTSQPVVLNFGTGGLVTTSVTNTEFDQRYAGLYAVANRERITVDVQVRYEDTEYTLNESVVDGFDGLGLSNSSFSTDAVNMTARLSYQMDVNDDGLIFVPTTGFSITRTGSSRLAFTPDGDGNSDTLDLDSYVSKVGFIGGALAKTRVSEAGDAASTLFFSGNYYREFGGDRTSTFTPVTGDAASITSSSIGGFAEASVGWNYVKVLENGPAGARQLNSSIRADARFGPNVSDSYSLTAQIRLSF